MMVIKSKNLQRQRTTTYPIVGYIFLLLLLLLVDLCNSFSLLHHHNNIYQPSSSSSRRRSRRDVGLKWSLFSSTTDSKTKLNSQQQQSSSSSSSSSGSNVNSGTVIGPPMDTKPDYENIHGPFGEILDKIFLSLFRTRMAEKVGIDSSLPKDDYNGIIELTAALNSRFSNRTEVQKIAQDVLRSLFPSWLPGQYAILFSKPFPEFSARMNAWATRVGGTWLMGECEVNDVEINGITYKDQGLLVKRCRFLEEAGCASVCVNSCKVPTQNFFIEDMGLPLTMTPDYDTFECQFTFGELPTNQNELDAKNTPCLSRCPSAGSMRRWHDTYTNTNSNNNNVNNVNNDDSTTTTTTTSTSGDESICPMMEGSIEK